MDSAADGWKESQKRSKARAKTVLNSVVEDDSNMGSVLGGGQLSSGLSSASQATPREEAGGVLGGGAAEAGARTVNLSNSETIGKFCYEIGMTVLIFWNCLEIPYRIAFFPPIPFSYLVVVAIIDWIFVADCAARFYLPYLSKSGYYIKSGPAIRRHYLRTWFAVDAISSIPWDFMLMCIELSSPALAQQLTFFRYVRITRMIRLISISVRLREWEITLNWNLNLLWLRAARLVVTLIIWLNTCACIFGLIFDQERLVAGSAAWVYDGPPQQVALDLANPFSQYQAALYFAVVTFTTIGYGDYTATTIPERAFDVVFIFVNLWILTIIVGTVTSWLQAAEKSRTALADKLNEIKEYCAFRGLPVDINAEMQRFFRFRASVKGYEGTDFDALSELTPALRQEVAQHMRHTVLRNFGLAAIVDKQFLTALVLRLKRERRSQGEYLSLQNTSARKFFVLANGRAAVLRDGLEIMTLVDKYCCFGEAALLSDGLRRTTSVRAFSTCDLLSLTREDMLDLMKLFPRHVQRVEAYAQDYATTFEQRNPNLGRMGRGRKRGKVPDLDDQALRLHGILDQCKDQDVSGAQVGEGLMKHLGLLGRQSHNGAGRSSLKNRFVNSAVPLNPPPTPDSPSQASGRPAPPAFGAPPAQRPGMNNAMSWSLERLESNARPMMLRSDASGLDEQEMDEMEMEPEAKNASTTTLRPPPFKR